MAKNFETRWIALGVDGRHVTLGRHTDPTDAEIAATEAALTAQGQTGFLVVVRGAYYARGKVELLQVRPLAGAAADQWDAAAAAFLAKRKAALAA